MNFYFRPDQQLIYQITNYKVMECNLGWDFKKFSTIKNLFNYIMYLSMNRNQNLQLLEDITR